MTFKIVSLLKYYIENATQKIQTLSIRIDDFYTPFTVIISVAIMSGKTEWGKTVEI